MTHEDRSGAEAALEVMATTRAIRRFHPEPIPERDLARMFFAATRAPSPSNRQNFRFLVLDRTVAAEARAVLGEEYRRRWAEKRERDGYDAAAQSVQRPGASRMVAAMEYFVDHFESIPVITLACLVRYQDAGPLEGAAVYPACQNLLLAARALGFGGVLTQWHTGVEGRLRGLLMIPKDVMIGGVVALGRPVGRHGPVRRLPLPDLVFENTWGAPAAWAEDPPEARFTRAGPPRTGSRA